MKRLAGVVGLVTGTLLGSLAGCANTVQEICTDTIDNDSDGLADCDDPDCANDATCVAPTTGTALIEWTITDDGLPMECADVGGVTVTVTDPESGALIPTPCEDGAVQIVDIPVGTYSVDVGLLDSEDEEFGTVAAISLDIIGGQETVVVAPFEFGDPPPACDTILIHKVYTSGGQDASGFSHDFIVLHNMADVATPLDGWTLQFHNGPAAWTVVDLAAQDPDLEIAAGGYLLVRLGTSGQGGTQLPAPDVVGPQLDIGATSLVVAVMHDTAAIDQQTCPDNASDLFGTKGAGCSEGGALFGGPGFDQAFVRDGCDDTQVNSADFSISAAGPVENGGTAASVCSSCE